jgi:DNA processing protein
MQAECAHWLALNRLPALSREVLVALVEGRRSARDIVATACPAANWSAVQADLDWLERPGRHLVTLAMSTYPARLRQIPDPPPVLFVLGDPHALGVAQVAVVGSRRATPCGLETAHALAAALARCGLTVTSGLALGVDTAGHRGALAAGGRSVAVAGNGLDRVYPRRNRLLARQLAERGALVSEFPPGTPPLAGNFPRRNRIISGLCLGVVVVEAARRSGSLITARLAGEHGREVFAVPGPIQSPLAGGCHDLIRQGAKLVEGVSDVLEELPESTWTAPENRTDGVAARQPRDLDAAQRKVLGSVAHGATSVDSVVERSGLTADTVCSILLALELRGLIVPVPGGAYCRVAGDTEY